MNFKNIFNSYFKYTPKEHYNFTLPEDNTNQNLPTNQANMPPEKSPTIYPSLNVNLEYMKTKYNTLINSDIKIRQFTLNARGKQYDAFIAYIDGMVDSKVINDFILEPLMLRNKNNLFEGSQNKVISEAVANNITVRKVKKFDLSNYLLGCLMPQNSVEEVSEFNKVANRNQFSVIVFYLLKLYLLPLTLK